MRRGYCWRMAALPFIQAMLGGTVDDGVAEPIRLHPDNPHYFLFRCRPTLLVTSGEHYGAVLNLDFDYKAYLAVLSSHGFNLTRTFSGAYCEPPGAFKIESNTLAPAPGRLICPWARSEKAGYARSGNRFDLTRWDPAYFARLEGFVAEAGRRGIVVEMVLFCPFYEESMWALSPMNGANNVNGIGNVPRAEVYTLRHPRLLATQEAMVRRIVEALKDHDNVYYEICNEPYARKGGVSPEWQNRIAETIVDAEADFPSRHLIAQNIANKSAKVSTLNPHVSILNFHYARSPAAVSENYRLSRPIADDETGFRGSQPSPYRMEGWSFLLSGGAIYSNLDYSFTCARPDGTAELKAPGGGGPELRRQLTILKEFVNGLDFVRMRPDASVVRLRGRNGSAFTLVHSNGSCAAYVAAEGALDLTIELSAGDYWVEWVNTKTGGLDKTERLRHAGGEATLKSPAFDQDIALRILRER